MGARIVVQSGISTGASHWVERNVVRVGSEPGSDMVIPCPSVDPHALTVEFRKNQYRVYNRSSEQIVVGGRLLERGQYTTWADADLLEMQSDVTLALELDADPSPTPQPVFDRTDGQALASGAPAADAQLLETVAPTTAASAVSPSAEPGRVGALAEQPSPGLSKTTLQWAVTGLCVVGCVLLLARHQLRGESETRAPAPKLEEVVRGALGSDDPAVVNLVDKLQLAEAAYLRGQKEIARAGFRSIHDLLKASVIPELKQADRSPPPEEPESPSDTNHSPATIAPPAAVMQQFVEHRLRQLGS
ncbi:MAG: hypothetical protein Aurels2KO_03640 [Aureliella sp.]